MLAQETTETTFPWCCNSVDMARDGVINSKGDKMKEVIAECRMKYNGFSKSLKIDDCRKLFDCNKDNIDCYACPCFGMEIREKPTGRIQVKLQKSFSGVENV